MSSVPKYNPSPAYPSKTRTLKITFQVMVRTPQLQELVELVELIYHTRIRVEYRNGINKLHFRCSSGRSQSGIRFATRIYGAELLDVKEWF